VADEGRRYGRAFAHWHDRVPLYRKEIWRLGARLNGDGIILAAIPGDIAKTHFDDGRSIPIL